MNIDWQLECLRYRFLTLTQEISRVKDKDHPYDEPVQIYNSLLSLLMYKSNFLEEAVEIYRARPDTERALSYTILELVKDVEYASDLFSLAHRVDSSRIPFEILSSLSWAAKNLLGGPCRAVVRLDPNYNYSIISLHRTFEELGWTNFWTTRSYSTILLLGFPSAEVTSILVHAIAAHEFGHELANRFREPLELILGRALATTKRSYTSEIQDYVADRYLKRRGVRQQDAIAKLSKQAEDDINQVSAQWVKEVFADLVAARLVGPAFLAAFDRVLLGVGEPFDTHPPGHFRRQLVRQYLEIHLPQVAIDDVWNVLLSTSVPEPMSYDLPYRIAEEVCRKGFDEISKVVQQLPSPLADAGDALPNLVTAIQEHIQNLSPPSSPLRVAGEIQTANMFWLLLYAAWHFRLHEDKFYVFAKDHGWTSNLAHAETALGNLILHALQSLELRFRWNSTGRDGHDSKSTVTLGAQAS